MESDPGTGPWVPLQVDGKSQIFARLIIASGGYTLYLADVAKIEFWIETLPKDRVIQRTEDDDCIIDANDPAQLSLLLQKLGLSLQSGVLEVRQTARGLRLKSTLQMDSGPFEWTFRLSQSSGADANASLQKSLLMGLINVTHSLVTQVGHLQTELTRKDYHLGAMQRLLLDTEPGKPTEYKPKKFMNAAYKSDPKRLLAGWQSERRGTTETEAMQTLAHIDPSMWVLHKDEAPVPISEPVAETSFVEEFVDDTKPQELQPLQGESLSQVPPPVCGSQVPDNRSTDVPEAAHVNNTFQQAEGDNGSETEDEEDGGITIAAIEGREDPATPEPEEENKDQVTPVKKQAAQELADMSQNDPFSMPDAISQSEPQSQSDVLSSSQQSSQRSPKRRIGSLQKHIVSSPTKSSDADVGSDTANLKRKQLEDALEKKRKVVKKKRRF